MVVDEDKYKEIQLVYKDITSVNYLIINWETNIADKIPCFRTTLLVSSTLLAPSPPLAQNPLNSSTIYSPSHFLSLRLRQVGFWPEAEHQIYFH